MYFCWFCWYWINPVKLWKLHWLCGAAKGQTKNLLPCQGLQKCIISCTKSRHEIEFNDTNHLYLPEFVLWVLPCHISDSLDSCCELLHTGLDHVHQYVSVWWACSVLHFLAGVSGFVIKQGRWIQDSDSVPSLHLLIDIKEVCGYYFRLEGWNCLQYYDWRQVCQYYDLLLDAVYDIWWKLSHGWLGLTKFAVLICLHDEISTEKCGRLHFA